VGLNPSDPFGIIRHGLSPTRGTQDSVVIAESLPTVIADCEATDHEIRTLLADIRAMRLVARQALDPRHQYPRGRVSVSNGGGRFPYNGGC
jgi:hypothetical protein